MNTSSNYKVIITSGFPAAMIVSILCDVSESHQPKYILEQAKHTDLNQFYSDTETCGRKVSVLALLFRRPGFDSQSKQARRAHTVSPGQAVYSTLPQSGVLAPHVAAYPG